MGNRLLCAVSILLVGSTLSAGAVSAETVRIGTLPTKVGAAGFMMTAEMEVVAGNGYQPVHLRFSPLGKAFGRDRNLQIAIEPFNNFRTDLDFSFRRSITIAQGSPTTSMVVYVPHYYAWESLKISLFEDGRPIEKGAMEFGLANGLRARFAEQTSSVGIIAPSDASIQDAAWKVYPDVRTLVTVLGDGPIPEDSGTNRLAHQAALKHANQVQPAWVQFRPIDESELHDHWLGYSQLDVILVAGPVLERIEQQQPAQFQHLKNWLAAGGNLWVYAAAALSGESFVSELKLDPATSNKVMSPKGVAASLNLATKNDNSELMYDSWNGVRKESTQYAYRSGGKTMSIRQDVFKELQNKKHPFTQSVPANQIAAALQVGSFGLGTVVTIDAEDPFPGSYQFWNSVVGLHPKGQVVWTERMGIDVPRGNDNYWMWLIPSVGQPPVKSFVFLNSLFVILVGPICYFFFRKRQRLYLLYFFAPTLAILVTVSLFAYALGADGTKTKVRSRQLTWIDSVHGCAVDQSRQTYYAVLGSRGGLEFPSDAAVYPVRNTPAFNRYHYRRRGTSGRRGDIAVTADSCRFDGVFFPPRNQVQYLITRPRTSDESIEFSFTETCSVTSRWPVALKQLVARDAGGKYWCGQNIAPGDSTELEPCTATVLGEMLGSSVLPTLGSVPMLQNNQRIWGGPGTGIQVSLLETRLEKWSKNFPTKAFVATTEVDDDHLGVNDAIVLDSVQVVMGEIP